MMEFPATLVDALRLLVLRRPSNRWRRIGPGQFWLAALALLAVNLADSWLSVPAPRVFDRDALRGLSFYILLALLVAWAACSRLRRPVLFWPLATLLLLIETLVGSIVLLLDNTLFDHWWPNRDPDTDHTALLLWLVWTMVAIRRLFDHLEPQRRWPTRTLATLAVSAAITLPAWFIERGSFFYPADWETPLADVEAPQAPAFEPEELMAAQPQRLDAALAQLAPQRAGEIDLYVITFGGDGSERVFRNEALFAQALFAQRYGAHGHTLALVNDAERSVDAPLATRSNLQRALLAIATQMDREEDLLLLYLTSHGGESPELLVALDPLPLAQIDPAWLAASLQATGIAHRIVVLSACYSGGFLPTLADAQTLVMTAARADRPSFGCGPDSDITYFGRAWLSEALNQDTDLVAAFERAKTVIAERENAAGFEASMPQIARNPAVEAQLERWRKTLAPAAMVPFDPAQFAPPEAR